MWLDPKVLLLSKIGKAFFLSYIQGEIELTKRAWKTMDFPKSASKYLIKGRGGTMGYNNRQIKWLNLLTLLLVVQLGYKLVNGAIFPGDTTQKVSAL